MRIWMNEELVGLLTWHLLCPVVGPDELLEALIPRFAGADFRPAFQRRDEPGRIGDFLRALNTGSPQIGPGGADVFLPTVLAAAEALTHETWPSFPRRDLKNPIEEAAEAEYHRNFRATFVCFRDALSKAQAWHKAREGSGHDR